MVTENQELEPELRQAMVDGYEPVCVVCFNVMALTVWWKVFPWLAEEERQEEAFESMMERFEESGKMDKALKEWRVN